MFFFEAMCEFDLNLFKAEWIGWSPTAWNQRNEVCKRCYYSFGACRSFFSVRRYTHCHSDHGAGRAYTFWSAFINQPAEGVGIHTILENQHQEAKDEHSSSTSWWVDRALSIQSTTFVFVDDLTQATDTTCAKRSFNKYTCVAAGKHYQSIATGDCKVYPESQTNLGCDHSMQSPAAIAWRKPTSAAAHDCVGRTRSGEICGCNCHFTLLWTSGTIPQACYCCIHGCVHVPLLCFLFVCECWQLWKERLQHT